MFRDSEDMYEHIPEATGILARKNHNAAKILVKPLIDVFNNNEIPIERREVVVDAFNMMLSKTQLNDDVREYIRGELNKSCIYREHEPEIREQLKQVINKWGRIPYRR